MVDDLQRDLAPFHNSTANFSHSIHKLFFHWRPVISLFQILHNVCFNVMEKFNLPNLCFLVTAVVARSHSQKFIIFIQTRIIFRHYIFFLLLSSFTIWLEIFWRNKVKTKVFSKQKFTDLTYVKILFSYWGKIFSVYFFLLWFRIFLFYMQDAQRILFTDAKHMGSEQQKRFHSSKLVCDWSIGLAAIM